MPHPRTGLLIIRAWREAGSTEPLRAQIRVADDISVGIDRTLTLVHPEAAGELVEGWLREILDAPST